MVAQIIIFADCPFADCPFGNGKQRVVFLPRNIMTQHRDKHINIHSDTGFQKDRTGSKTAGVPCHQGYFVESKIGVRIANFLVDTGSGYSIINEELFELLSEDDKP